MAIPTFTSVTYAGITEDVPYVYSFTLLKYRANESSNTTAFRITSLGRGLTEYYNGSAWVAITDSDVAAGVWYSSAGVTVGTVTFPGSLRVTAPKDYSGGIVEIFYLVATTATNSSGEESSPPVKVYVTVAGTQDPGLVVITGNGAIGQVLTATTSDPDGMLSQFSYQWQVNTGTSIAPAWGDVSGATASSFTPTAAEAGREVRARASYTDALGKAEVVYSDPVAIFMSVQAVRVWTGSAWVDAKALRRYDGAQWVDIPISAIRALP